MAVYFPQINAAGLMVQRPYTATLEYQTAAADAASGRRFARTWRDSPLGRWDLQWPSITEAEAAVLEAFFVSREGRLQEFTFLDPGGNLVPASEDYAAASWERHDVTVGAAATDPFGGSRARALAGGANGMIATVVLPDGDADGFVLCGSVWVRSASGGSLSIGFIDSGFDVLGQTTHYLPAGSWRRISHAQTIGTNSPVRLLVGGLGTWAGATLEVFGAQVAPLPGPGGYQKTPGGDGLRAKCRFDSDALELKFVGPGQVAARLKVIEIR
jgi:hypothetical protein